MFGGGYFENEFGELSVLSNIMDGGTGLIHLFFWNSAAILLLIFVEGHTESDKDSKYKKMAEEKEQKNKKLEVKLLIKLEPHLSGNVEGKFWENMRMYFANYSYSLGVFPEVSHIFFSF